MTTSENVVISAPAGTGKTTVVTEYLKGVEGKNVAVMSFTNQAVKVLKSKIPVDELESVVTFETVHHFLYKPMEVISKLYLKGTTLKVWDNKSELSYTEFLQQNPDNEFDAVKELDFNLCGDTADYDLLIIDEISMLSDSVMTDVINYVSAHNCRVVLLGDWRQLPPIGDTNAISMELLDEENKYTISDKLLRYGTMDYHLFKLDENMRSSGEYGDECLKAFNAGKLTGYFNQFFHGITPTGDLDTLYLTYRNAQVNKYNAHVLSTNPRIIPLYVNHAHHSLWCKGDTLYLHVDQTVILDAITVNQPFSLQKLLEFGTLTTEPDGKAVDKSGLFIAKQFGTDSRGIDLWKEELEAYKIGREEHYDAVAIPSFALTVHKCQGSERDVILLDLYRDCSYDREIYSKWLYTALTRCRKQIVISKIDYKSWGTGFMSLRDYYDKLAEESIDEESLMIVTALPWRASAAGNWYKVHRGTQINILPNIFKIGRYNIQQRDLMTHGVSYINNLPSISKAKEQGDKLLAQFQK
jgi:hypothetical protein